MGRLYGTISSITEPISGGGRLYGGRLTGKSDLGTSEGLYHLAESSGLGEQAKKIMSDVGEEPKKIWSGGWISDIFDAMNILQYGVVGVIKGKGFWKGVRTRQSFSDKDALGNFGLPGTIMGIIADIAVDPMTYITPWTILKKAPGVTKFVDELPDLAKATRIGQWFGRTFIYRFGQDPIYAELAERSIKNIAVGQANLLDIVRPLTKLDPEVQKAIGVARKAGKLDELAPNILKKAKPAFDALDDLGRKAVDVGLLSRKTWEENVGSYMARLYKKWEAPEEAIGIAQRIRRWIWPVKPKRIDLSRFMTRTDIPEHVREAMGEILEAGYPTAKSLIQLNSAVENANFFNTVARKWGSDVAKDGLQKLPITKRLGELAGKFVPNTIFDDIQEIITPMSGLQRKLNKGVGGFKFGKVILNPATHGRNIISNFILNSWEGLSPARLDIYGEAAKQLTTKGKWYQEAMKEGLGLNTFAAQEISSMLMGPEGLTSAGKFKKFWGTIANKLTNLYQGEENFAKLAQYIFQRKKGLSTVSAWKIAERATFNYAQVTPFIRKLRTSIFGFPFITFTYKVTPQVAKTFLKAPTKISNLGKIKNAIENMANVQETKRERASEPSWVRDGFYIKVPIKDKHGRSVYFDMTYILPFGDLISGQLIERQVKRETGLKESWVEALLRKSPFINVIREISQNQDFYGNKIWREADSQEKQLGDLFRHLTKTYMPPLVADQLPGGYIAKGKKAGQRRPRIIERIKEPKTDTEYRDLQQEMLRNVGIKLQPINVDIQESWRDWDKKRALETLLSEAGILQQFQRYYIPKEERLIGVGRGRLYR